MGVQLGMVPIGHIFVEIALRRATSPYAGMDVSKSQCGRVSALGEKCASILLRKVDVCSHCGSAGAALLRSLLTHAGLCIVSHRPFHVDGVACTSWTLATPSACGARSGRKPALRLPLHLRLLLLPVPRLSALGQSESQPSSPPSLRGRRQLLHAGQQQRHPRALRTRARSTVRPFLAYTRITPDWAWHKQVMRSPLARHIGNWAIRIEARTAVQQLRRVVECMPSLHCRSSPGP